ncbi:BAR domain-containing protein [Nocardia macrotermitis]|uniref:Tetratricopeptide repeat protein n=1 Tax=Nocardia macrotermitis TaxID=2585198 RepID=A0A7K0CVN0_9NOCA|nr:hypothetical protein [Nocardia macrotermitis]MQY17498.1 hypothetical protein [Nocardia macrotermitis]
MNTTDDTMTAITVAVQHGHEGDPDTARRELLHLWDAMGPLGDPLHRCTLAHYLADLYDDAAQSLIWDIRALDAAAALTDERARRHHPALRVRGFYPSLHLNLADNLRRLGSFDAADQHLDAAREYFDALGPDAYGEGIRSAADEVAAAVRARSTARRDSAPDGRS